MAYEAKWNEENKSLLSKAKIGGNLYLLKDTDAQANIKGLIKALADSAYIASTSNKADIKADGATLLTGKAVYDYIVENLQDTVKGVVFRGVSKAQPVTGTVAMKDGTTLTAKTGDMVIFGIKEYIYDGSKWIELGDETLYLTPDSASQTYVAKTFEIAGLAMDGTEITVEQLKTALGLKALAYMDKGSVKISTADSISNISVGKAGNYNLSCNAAGEEIIKTFAEMDVTPAGTVSVSAGKDGSVTYTKATGISMDKYTPAGDITLPTLTLSQATTKADVATVTFAGTGYSITEGGVSQANSTPGAFNTDAMKAHVGKQDNDGTDVDDETLVLVDAATANAITAVGAVSYTAPVLSGALPTFGTQNVIATAATPTVNEYTKKIALAGTAATLTGSITSDEAAVAGVKQPTFTASFNGTTKKVTPAAAVDGKVKLAPATATVTVAAQDTAITLNKSEKTVDVAFVANK